VLSSSYKSTSSHSLTARELQDTNVSALKNKIPVNVVSYFILLLAQK
jgi:hypothetical protein